MTANYVSPVPFNLVIVRKFLSLNGRDFTVTDDQGNPLFRLKDHVFHLHDHRVLLDANNSPVLTLRNKIRTMHGGWEVFRGKSTKDCDFLFTTKKTSMIQFKVTLDVFLAENKDQNVCDFKVKASFIKNSCTIFAGESSNIVAKMNKKMTVESVLLDKTKFIIEVNPNIDYAFITSIIVILDEIRRHSTIKPSTLLNLATQII